MLSTGGLSLSLTHDITSSLGLGLSSTTPKFTPYLHRHTSVRVDPYPHPQHIKVLKHFVYMLLPVWERSHYAYGDSPYANS